MRIGFSDETSTMIQHCVSAVYTYVCGQPRTVENSYNNYIAGVLSMESPVGEARAVAYSIPCTDHP